MWINYNDAEKAYYEVTYSNDGKRFTTLKNIYPNKVSAEKLNHFSTSSDSLFGKYIQIVAINKDQRKSFSNIIYIRNNKSRESPYPNPSHEIIFFDATPPIMKLHFIIMDQNGITIIPVYTTENNRYRLDISSLRAGNYVLMLSDGKLKKSYPFIKIN